MRILLSCWFDLPGTEYGRLARVLEYSARRHLAGWEVRVEKIDLPGRDLWAGRSASDVTNTHKLDWWSDRFREITAGDEVLLIDADTMILRGLDDVWGRAFDFAYTTKDRLRSPYPLNAGVVFARATAGARLFIDTWQETNRSMIADRTLHATWRRLFGGMNQAALGKLLTDGHADKHAVHLETLPCVEWNCEDTSWQAFMATTRIVHVKSALHRAVLGQGGAHRVQKLVRMWRQLEREARALGVA